MAAAVTFKEWLDEKAKNKECIMMDGSFATELDKTEVQYKEHPGWTAAANLDYPEIVQGIYENYISNGSTIFKSNTYHHAYKLLEPIVGDKMARDSFRQSVTGGHVARFSKHSEGHVKLLTSIGSYATELRDGSEYTGAYVNTAKMEDVVAYYKKQLEMADSTDSDAIIFETIPTMLDVAAILQCMKAKPDTEYAISLCLENRRLRDGTPIEEALEILLDCLNVIVLGINCSDPRDGVAQIKEIAESGWLEAGRHIFYAPNSGESFVNGSYHGEPVEVHKFVKEWHEAGAIAIGGCCRVGLKEMRLVKDAVYDINCALNRPADRPPPPAPTAARTTRRPTLQPHPLRSRSSSPEPARRRSPDSPRYEESDEDEQQ